MYNDNTSIFSSIILLVSLLQRIKGDFDVIKEQREIASRPQLENNFAKTPGESVITTAITVDDEKFDDNELRKVFVQNFKLYENLEGERNRNDALGTLRKTRATTNDTSKLGMECLSCFANGTSRADEHCYKGTFKHKKTNIVRCSDAEQCYTEVNPTFIKRGCMLYGRGNRTFYCKCPLCNDKPSYEYSYYDYKSYNDWVYDNFLLQKSIKGMDGLCKVCETTGTNALADKNCRLGKPSDYMVCGPNQVCYVNIDDEVDHVSRGCKTRPVFNSLYSFCNKTLCNTANFVNPKLVFNQNYKFFRASQLKMPRSFNISVPTYYSDKTMLMVVLIFILLC